jgi:hypothetical protein
MSTNPDDPHDGVSDDPLRTPFGTQVQCGAVDTHEPSGLERPPPEKLSTIYLHGVLKTDDLLDKAVEYIVGQYTGDLTPGYGLQRALKIGGRLYDLLGGGQDWDPNPDDPSLTRIMAYPAIQALKLSRRSLWDYIQVYRQEAELPEAVQVAIQGPAIASVLDYTGRRNLLKCRKKKAKVKICQRILAMTEKPTGPEVGLMVKEANGPSKPRKPKPESEWDPPKWLADYNRLLELVTKIWEVPIGGPSEKYARLHDHELYYLRKTCKEIIGKLQVIVDAADKKIPEGFEARPIEYSINPLDFDGVIADFNGAAPPSNVPEPEDPDDCDESGDDDTSTSARILGILDEEQEDDER